MTNPTLKLAIGCILQNDNKRERIIHTDRTFVVTVDLDTTKLNFNRYKPSDVFIAITNGEIQLIEDTDNLPIINYNTIPKKYQDIFDRNQKIVNDFAQKFGAYYEEFRKRNDGNIIAQSAKYFGVDVKAYLKIVREYFQSGCSDVSLYSKRTPGLSDKKSNNKYTKKTGRPPIHNNNSCYLSSEVLSQFQEGLNELLSGKRWTSVTNAYDHIIQKYYTKEVFENGVLTLFEEDSDVVPTYKQFYHFIRKNTTQKQFDLIKTSAQEVRNDMRLLLSDSNYGVYGIGDLVEIDACEVDVSLVDVYDYENVVARPILYCMIDVCTKMILAISVAFENNSILGVTNLFLNLSDDKVEYCKRFGIELDPYIWRSNIIPRRIRFDRGAECTSNQLERILNKLGIERELVTAGTGSLKGNIEQQFHQMHLAQNHLLEDKGLIEKRYDSKHHQEAVLTIEEYTKIVINFVLAHNQMAIKNYKRTKDMVAKGIEPVPVKLWDYFAEQVGLPRLISSRNIDQFRFDLLQEYEAKISREGIHFVGGHLYYNENDEKLKDLMYDAGDNKKTFKVRYDPRNVNQLYYLQGTQLMVATLNMKKQINEGYENLTFLEMKNLDTKHKHTMYVANTKTGAIRRARESANKAIIDATTYFSGDSKITSTKEIRKNRTVAQQNQRFDNSIASRYVENVEIEQPKSIEEVIDTTLKNELEQKLEYYQRNINNLTDEELRDYERIAEKMVNEL